MKKELFIYLAACLFIFSACEPDEKREVMGLKPVYGSPEDLEIRFLPAQEICKPGKIYLYGSYLLINEVHKGIHFIDNSDPKQPVNLGFAQIAGNVDMAVKNSYLYADHLSSMVVIDITNPAEAKFVRAVENAISQGRELYPAQTNVLFECVDPDRGPVIGWAEALLTDPQCYR